MRVMDVRSARTDLDALIDLACAGEEVVIAVDGHPRVQLVPLRTEAVGRKRGSLEGEVVVPDAFFKPLPDEELKDWER